MNGVIMIENRWRVCLLAERFGAGDGEQEALTTRQMPSETFPACVLFGLWLIVMGGRHG
jgi:hypothetical protein